MIYVILQGTWVIIMYKTKEDLLGLPAGSDDKESTWNAGDSGSIPRKIPWRREWLPTLVFLPGEFHG